MQLMNGDINFLCVCVFASHMQMDLQLRNSLYQCNPRCSIEKRNIKNHSTSATPLVATNANAIASTATPAAVASAIPSSLPSRDRTFRPHDCTSSSMLNKIERDCTDKHELHRNNCLNETVSEPIYVLCADGFIYRK